MAQQQQTQDQFNFDIEKMIDVALDQFHKKPYIPYSHYAVGCALLCPDGTIIGGSNVENASYGLAVCAERSAVITAASKGYRSFNAVVVATRDGGTCCGMCRQVLREFMHPDDHKPVICITPDRKITLTTDIANLLPWSFGPENLGLPEPSQSEKLETKCEEKNDQDASPLIEKAPTPSKSYPFDLETLKKLALQSMSETTYSPYSKYGVGCAVVCEDGKIFTGSNIENASYGLTLCAERSAISAAASEGYRKLEAVVVATRDGGSCCGACRQFLREFMVPDAKKPIIMIRGDGTTAIETHIDELLPHSFGPENLDIDTPQ